MRLIRLIVLLAAATASAASGGSNGTVTSGPPAQQTGAPYAAPPAGTVEGQGYGGVDGSDRINFYFRKGGLLHYRDPQGWWEDGRWQQTGTQVVITLADGFVTYTGQVTGTSIVGTAMNKQKRTWRWNVQQGTPRQPAAIELAGTSWGGKEDKSCIVVHFKPGGLVEYETPSGHYDDGTWQIDGDWVYIKHAKTGFEYFGSIKAQHMNGNLWSQKGERWSWDVNKDVVPDECAGTSVAAGAKGGVKPPPSPVIGSIEGSTFEGDNGGDATTFQFRAGGVLVAKDPQGNWKGSWFQNGVAISFDLNNRYSWYEGILDGSGASITGGGHNKDGLDWRFSVKKK